MKIVSWNMAHTKAATLSEAWKWLDEESGADVLLLQETKWPEKLSGQWSSHSFNLKNVGSGGNWGTAVLARSDKYSPYILSEEDELLKSISGSFALLKPNDSRDPWFGSIHSHHAIVPPATALLAGAAEVLKGSKKDQYREIEIFAHEFKRFAGDAKFVIGGDLNLSLLWDEFTGQNTSRDIFNNLDSIGFQRLGPEPEIQTYWKTNSGPFQLDHAFSDGDLSKKLRRFRAISALVTESKLSDHAPVIIEFN